MDSAVCSVCISALVEELCVPCSNNHKFHRACLLEWATTLHTCPMCREDFEEIIVYNKEGQVLETIKAPAPNKDKHRELHDVVFDPPYANMACELCHALTDEAHMILCDICDLGFHIYCLRPPLSSIPSGRWECERCRPGTSFVSAITNHTIGTRDHSPTMPDQLSDGFIDDEEEEEQISDDEIVSSEDDESASTSQHDEEPVEYDDDEVLGNGLDMSNIPSTSHSTLTMKDLKKGRAKKKPSRRRKSRKSSSKTSDPNKPRRKSSRRKRGSKRKSKSKRRHHKKNPAESGEAARNRIANVCGIDLKHSDNYKVVRKGSSRDTAASSSSSKLVLADRKLDLVGQKWVLPPDSDPDLATDKPSTSAVEPVKEKQKQCGSPQFRGSLSLLDEIMANQSKVLAPSNLLKINRDGSLAETDDYKKYLERRDKKREKESDPKEVSKEPKKSPSSGPPKVEKKDQKQLVKEETTTDPRLREIIRKGTDHKVEDKKLRQEKEDSEQKPVKLVKKDMAASACPGKGPSIEPSSSSTKTSSSNTKRSRWQPVSSNGNSSHNIDINPSPSKINHSESSKYAKNNNSHIPPLQQCANPVVVNPFEFLLQQQQQQQSSAVNFPNQINFNSRNIDPLRSLAANPAAMQQLLAGAFPTVSTGNGLLQNMQSLMSMPSTASTQSIMESAVAAMNASNKPFSVPTSLSTGLLGSNNSSLFDLINGTTPASANSLLQPSYSHLNNLQPLSNNNSNLSTMEIIAQLFNNQSTTLPSLNPLFLRPNVPQPAAPSLVQQQPPPSKSSVLAPPPPRQEYKKLVPPPPPPTAPDNGVQSSASKIHLNLMDSPMDIDMDDGDESTPVNGNNGNKKPSKEIRSATVKLADAAMKAALKPYFAKRLISKDEYKEIMKKGVSKLRNCESLKQAKVDRFVKQYVDVAISKRKSK